MIIIPAIHITFNLNEPLSVPINYQHLLQAFVYSILPQQEASHIHDKGFQHNNRSYKLFCFSKLQGEKTHFDKGAKKLTFHKKLTLSISSIIPEIVEKTANYLMLTESLQFHGHKIAVNSLDFEKFNISKDNLVVNAVSPITVYSTFQKRNGSKITHYFTPDDHVFEHLIEENFARKYEAFTGTSLIEENNLITIKPLSVTKRNKVVTNYKGTWITGWTGKYELKGKPEYLSFLLNTGISSKNSSGFGMVLPTKTLPKRN